MIRASADLRAVRRMSAWESIAADTPVPLSRDRNRQALSAHQFEIRAIGSETLRCLGNICRLRVVARFQFVSIKPEVRYPTPSDAKQRIAISASCAGSVRSSRSACRNVVRSSRTSRSAAALLHRRLARPQLRRCPTIRSVHQSLRSPKPPVPHGRVQSRPRTFSTGHSNPIRPKRP